LEANPPLIVDANAELALSVSLQPFETIAGQHGKIFERYSRFQTVQLQTRGTLDTRERFDVFAGREVPRTLVTECLDNFERFLHDEKHKLPLLVEAGLLHVQFETIHPFLDGNGRLGRLLITLLLCSKGALREPLLYLSLYFKTNRAQYYDLLQRVRTEGAWEEWLAFFLEGTEVTARAAAEAAKEILTLFAKDRDRIQTIGRAASSALRVHEYMQKKPLASIGALPRTCTLYRWAS
jgi:Fic family protein